MSLEVEPSSRPVPPSARGASLAARYRSLFVLGRGGMGTVEAALEIQAHEERHYQRVVALKRLLPDAARDPRKVDMFLREARLAAMLDHPNVVTAFDYGELDGELYLAMEYVEGQSLAKVIRALAERKGELSLDVLALVLAEVCRGLHAAHELVDPETNAPLNLVHRDVSPQNVMIGYDGRVRLLDFGVAKIETENVTKTGEVKGKTAYMSPEQAMGDPLDRRSDLFGVGALLFECLSLRRMWGDGTDMDVIRKLALESPPALDASGRDVPASLTTLYGRLVAREASARPATALEVASALDALVPDREVAAAALVALLDAHFVEQAKAQRARLTLALDEVAPDQADELRQSLVPMSEPPGSRATPTAEPTGPPPTPARSRAPLVFGALLVLGALVAWRVTSSATSLPDRPPPAPLATTAEAPSSPPREATDPPPPRASASSTDVPPSAPSLAPKPAPTVATPSAAPPRTSTTPTTRQPAAPTTAAQPATTPPATPATTPPTATARPTRPPASVDPDPF